MEENNVELFDYLRVIWKRKILIIVMILVCTGIGAGVGVKNLRSEQKLSVTYQAEVAVKIGHKVKMTLTEAHLITMEKPELLAQRILIDYREKIKNSSKYHLHVEPVGMLPMLKLTMKGSDEGVERVLRELVEMLVEEHRQKAGFSYNAYKNFIKKLEEDAKMIQNNISVIETSIIKMRNKESVIMKHMDTSEKETEKGENLVDLSIVWNMLYLKTIDKEIDLSTSRQDLRNIQWHLLAHRTTIGDIEDYYTKMIGKIENTTILQQKRSTHKILIIAVVAGLILSLFTSFFIEYIEESMLRRKGK